MPASHRHTSFVGRQHLYIVVYETHDVEEAAESRQPQLFAA